MKLMADFNTEKEKEALIAKRTAQGGILVEEQDHFDGKHLIFEMPDVYDEVEDLKARIEKLEGK